MDRAGMETLGPLVPLSRDASVLARAAIRFAADTDRRKQIMRRQAGSVLVVAGRGSAGNAEACNRLSS
jgi:hypothetical protein